MGQSSPHQGNQEAQSYYIPRKDTTGPLATTFCLCSCAPHSWFFSYLSWSFFSHTLMGFFSTHTSCSRGCPCHLLPPQDLFIHDHCCRFFQPLQFPVPAPHAPKPPRLPWVSHHLAPNEARRPEVSASPSSSMAELSSIFLLLILSEGPRPFQWVVSVS